MADHTPASDGATGLGAYELQVYAMSPVAPSSRRLLAEAEGGGWPVELLEQDGKGPDDEGWKRLVLGTGGSGPDVVVSVNDQLEAQLAEFREAAGEGEEIPEALFEARRLYLIELPEVAGETGDEEGGGEAAFVLSAWALATLTDGLIFDPQEEFFADAESFLALLMDEEGADAGVGGRADD